MDNKIYELLVDRGAIMEGHFVLTSGLHSNKYVEKFRILENPESLGVICKAMADKYRGANVDIVVSAAIGGILISSGVAKELGVKGIFCERVGGEMLFKRGFSIPKGSNVLVVEDIVTTGGSIKEILKILDTLNVNLVSVCTLAHRGAPIEFGCGYDTLVNIDIETWEESQIPDWLAQIPITKPGSTGK
jgi:orotate phosphoribosyltransferase